MKKFLTRPGFEAIFIAGITLLFVLPAVVFAQQDVKNNPSADSIIKATPFRHYMINIGPVGVVSARTIIPNRSGYYTYADSVTIRGAHIYGISTLPYAAPDRIPTVRPDMSRYRMPVVRPHDEQNFDISSIDKNGIPTHSNFHVSAAMPDMEKMLAGGLPTDLAIVDIAMIPEFSSGKSLLVFTLPYNSRADISFTNSDGKSLWAEKSIGNKFNKSFLLPLNGVYYLVVKQSGKIAVKKVVKE